MSAPTTSGTKKYLPNSNELATKGEGGALAGMGESPHTTDFAEINIGLDQTTSNLKDPIVNNNPSMLTNPSFKLNKNGKPLAYFTAVMDNITGKVFCANTPFPINITQIQNAATSNFAPSGLLPAFSFYSTTAAYDGTNSFSIRTPTWVYQAQCTTVAATQVVPAVAAKKHRILGGNIVIAAGALAAGIETISILDVAAQFGTGGLIFSSYIPAAAGILGVGTVIPLNNLGNGFLTAAVNTVINVTLSLAVTAGMVSVTLWGCDE